MGLSSAVQWWEEWQLRILVLSSLSVQLFLFFAGDVRRLRRLRWLLWVAYIGGDALAVYALATLFNRQKQWTADGGSSALEVVWAPVLLIHLGGQFTITAYSLEDNELWRRHAITLVSQVTVALYVFVKWWSGEKRLLVAAVLLFVLGILKFSEKPWALRNASFNSILASTTVSPRREDGRLAVCWAWFTSSKIDKREGGGGERALSLKEYVQEAKVYAPLGSDQAKEAKEFYFGNLRDICKKFVDLSTPYSGRLSDLRSFLKLDEEKAYYTSQRFVGYIFTILYTRRRSMASPLGWCLTLGVPGFLALASVVLFAKSHKDGYNENDVRVTYILFCCTAVQSFLPWLIVCLGAVVFELLPRATRMVTMKRKLVSQPVSQHSLMSFCAREKKPTPLMKLATFGCLRRYVNKHWYISQVPAALQITKLVHRHVKDGWNTYITDPASYRAFNNLRGQLTLRRHHQLRQLRWSLADVPFDESVLVWHIATDLCFYQPAFSTMSPQHLQELKAAREISNYMVYLLFIHPEMLMPGTRPGLFTNAIYFLELIFKDSRGARLDNEETLAREIYSRVKDSRAAQLGNEETLAREIYIRGPPLGNEETLEREIYIRGPPLDNEETLAREIYIRGPPLGNEETLARKPTPPTDTATGTKTLITQACRLAKALMLLGEEAERWQVIQGVWVEMLCYSASRCSGYLHAKSLGEGGEYLTVVWLVWSYMGMETMADRLQRLEPPQEEEEEEEEEEGAVGRADHPAEELV